MEQRNCTKWLFFVMGFFIAGGIALAGFWIGRGLQQFRMAGPVVTVKGLAEAEVKSDYAIWKFSFKNADNNLELANKKVLKDKDSIIDFLKQNGFSDHDIEFSSFRVIDLFSREYSSGGHIPSRYIVEAVVIVKTPQVDLVESVSKKIDQLIRAGIVLDEAPYEANPRYYFSKLNDLRPKMLADATKSARTLAEQFALDSGAKVGSIRNADQGMFQISSANGSENEANSDVKSVKKKVRVVSTIEYALVN